MKVKTKHALGPWCDTASEQNVSARSEMIARHARQGMVFFAVCCAVNAVCLLIWGLA